MCLAYPGKIKSIKKDQAIVDFGGIEKEVNLFFVDAKEGEYVMVHAGFAIQKITNQEAQNAIEGFAEI